MRGVQEKYHYELYKQHVLDNPKIDEMRGAVEE